MTTDQLIRTYPLLYHMAEDGSWPSIRQHGLLSTRALLDLFQIDGADRDFLYSQHRSECVTIRHAEYGHAVIRDQKPMPAKRLQPSLQGGVTAREWYELINDRVFFWLSEARLLRLLSARAYRGRPHTVLHVETDGLVREYAEETTLTGINSGNTLPIARPRGRDTFKTIAEYPFEELRRRRGVRDAVVELSVEYAVRNVAQYVRRVERRQGNMLLEVLYG